MFSRISFSQLRILAPVSRVSHWYLPHHRLVPVHRSLCWKTEFNFPQISTASLFLFLVIAIYRKKKDLIIFTRRRPSSPVDYEWCSWLQGRGKHSFLRVANWDPEFHRVAVWGGVVDILLRWTLVCMILLLYIFHPVCTGKGTLHFTEVKSGSLSGATFFKKKKIRNQLLDMQSCCEPRSFNEISAVRTTVNLRKAADSSWFRWRWKDPNLPDPPPPWEVVSPVL